MNTRRLLVAFVLVVVFYGGDINAQTRRTRNKVEMDILYKFKIDGKTSKVEFTILLPRTIPNKQNIELSYSVKPKKVFMKNRNSYAKFVFNHPRKDFTLVIKVKADLFSYDLSTAANKRMAEPNEFVNLTTYLRDEKYLEKDDPSIKRIARNLRGRNEINRVRNIYNYVLGNLEYGKYNKKDMGAITAVKRKKGDCSEYADLFVVLCRAKKIPARVVSGYLTEYKGTAKHSWAEVYLEGLGWVPFDPTIGDVEDVSAQKRLFKNLSPIYIYLSHIRSDPVLENGGFYYYRYWGDKIEVLDQVRVTRPRKLANKAG
ncbi:transglutaminase family protein [Planctomycetota bacterium]